MADANLPIVFSDLLGWCFKILNLKTFSWSWGVFITLHKMLDPEDSSICHLQVISSTGYSGVRA